LDNSELAEFEASSRGYRGDIYVNIGGNYYNLAIYDIVRLQQDFEAEIQSYDFFSIEPNLIIVEEVTIVNIKKTIEKISRQKYFEKIKPIEKSEMKAALIQI
jgi:hypothetical protein